jgi:hypothetical protein
MIFFMSHKISRRSFFALSTSTVAAGLLAACGGKHEAHRISQAGEAPTTTAVPERIVTDVVLFRTGCTLQQSVLDTYDRILGANVLSSSASVLARTLRSHHSDHLALFQKETALLTGEVPAGPNAMVTKNIIDPSFIALGASENKPEESLYFLHALENIASATYQSFVPLLTKPSLRATIMRVSTTQTFHATLLATELGAKMDPSLDEKKPVAAKEGSGPTTTSDEKPKVVIPAYLVPSSFASLGLVPTLLNGKKVDFDLLGPNSYSY